MVKPSISERSPLSPTRWTTDAFLWPRSIAVFALIAIAVVAGSVLYYFVAVSLGTTPEEMRHDPKLTWGVAAGQYASYLPVLLVLLTMLPWLARRSLGNLGWRFPTARTIGAGLVGALAMYAVTIGVAGIQYAFTHQKPEETAIALFSSTKDPALLTAFVVLASVFAPLMEEFEFRGFLFNAILRYAPVWVAAVLSGIVFGAVHGSVSAFVPLACSGIVLAYVYYASGSLTAAAIAHALFNLVNVALLAFGKT